MNEIDELMNELMMYLHGLMNGTLATKDLETYRFIVTVSPDPDKIKIEDKQTHKIWKIEDFNTREIALLALLAQSEGL